jgi:hypothetical protein
VGVEVVEDDVKLAIRKSRGNGRALTGQSRDYKRHGTTTLFAALEVATGKIIAARSKRRRRVEFLDFMNSIGQLQIALRSLQSLDRRLFVHA